MSQPLPGLNAQVTVTVKPEDVGIFLVELRKVFEKIIEEPECISVDVYQSTEQPGVIHLVENWYVGLPKRRIVLTPLLAGANP